MAHPKIVFLMYHELELPGRAPAQADPGYTRYVVTAQAFREQLQWLKASAWSGLSVSQALAFPAQPGVAITFDDGCETDLLVAAEVLQRYAFGATFYITSGFLGGKGFLSQAQLRELSNAGFEIGCHSRTHAYLTDLAEHDLRREMAQPKLELEQIIGKPVVHFSCPGGRYNREIGRLARDCGYLSVATSRIQANDPNTHKWALGRVAVLRDLSIGDFGKLCRGQGFWFLNKADQVRGAARRVLGNEIYDQVRVKLLRVR